MKYFAIFFLGLLVTSGFSTRKAFAQQPPNNDSILLEITNSSSPYYYPVLMMRYELGDSTLNLSDYRHLYYGYPWQDTYKPFETPPAQDKILEFFAENPDLDNVPAVRLSELVGYANEVLKTEPFNPETINLLAFAYSGLGDREKEKIYYRKLQMIVAAIKSTGTGLKESSPWCIISFNHAVDLMGMMNALYKKPEIVSRSVEYVPLIAPKGKIKGYYFDFSRIYWFRPDKLPENKNSGWQFNGIPIKSRKYNDIN